MSGTNVAPCMLDGHAHVWSVDLTDWWPCESCDGTGRYLDAGCELDDIRFPECFTCGGASSCAGRSAAGASVTSMGTRSANFAPAKAARK